MYGAPMDLYLTLCYSLHVHFMYLPPLANIFGDYPSSSHHISDDTQASLSHKNSHSALNYCACLDSVQIWMTNNLLKLNPGKTEFMLIGSKL